MNKGKLYYYILVVILFTKCYYIPWYHPYDRLLQGGVRPKHPRFKYSKNPYILPNTTSLDTNAIYLHKSYNVYYGPTHLDSSFHFFRYFANGRVFCSQGLDHYPNFEDMNNLSAGLSGYYKIIEETLFEEIFTFWQGGTYDRQKVDIQGDSLIYYNTRWINPFTREKYISRVYIKVEIPDELLISQPDW